MAGCRRAEARGERPAIQRVLADLRRIRAHLVPASGLRRAGAEPADRRTFKPGPIPNTVLHKPQPGRNSMKARRRWLMPMGRIRTLHRRQ